MKKITEDLYAEVTRALRERIGAAEFFNGSIELTHDGTDAVLILTAIVYRRTVSAPDGDRRPIRDIVPVWWEFRTGGELNDFEFGELKQYLIEND